MAVHHHPHLLDFSSAPPNAVAEAPPPPSFEDHGQQLLALHGTDMLMTTVPHRVLVDDDTAAAWPPPVSLSLYNNYNTAAAAASLFVGHHQQQTSLAPNHHHQLHHQPLQQQVRRMSSTRYLGPVQELLSEFCSLEGDLLLHAAAMNGNGKQRDPNVEPSPSSSSSAGGGLWGHPSSLMSTTMDLLELERRKTRLLSMVEEVDRRYRRYREQIRSVEASFEAVAGGGAAQVYTRLALRAMSRHFRCLRDAVLAQLRAVRKACMGGDDRDGGGGPSPAAGATKGDTPRLKVLDQCLRQQRAFQQPPGSTIESYPWRPQRGLPERAVAVLRAWLFEHFLHPYPNDVDKHILARQTGLSRSQVSNWFINARVRLWKPMIEDMYTEEEKLQSAEASQNNPSGGGGGGTVVKPEHHHNTTTTALTAIGAGGGDQSHFRSAAASAGNNPSNSMLVSSSIVTDGDHLFSSCYPPASIHHGSHRHGAAVSLTLGLQQQQQPFIASGEATMMHQRSLMIHGDGEEEPVLPYRDLMGSQLLHDLTG